MPNAVKKLFRGNSPTSETTVYTAPAGTTAVVTNIVATNTDSVARTITVKLDNIEVVSALNINANTAVSIDLKQVVEPAGTVRAIATAAAVRLHISGMEVTA